MLRRVSIDTVTQVLLEIKGPRAAVPSKIGHAEAAELGRDSDLAVGVASVCNAGKAIDECNDKGRAEPAMFEACTSEMLTLAIWKISEKSVHDVPLLSSKLLTHPNTYIDAAKSATKGAE